MKKIIYFLKNFYICTCRCVILQAKVAKISDNEQPDKKITFFDEG